MSITAKQLTAKLLGKKIVKVKTRSGEDVEFEINKVSIESFAGEKIAKLETYAGKSSDEMKQILLDQFKQKEISSIISPVLLEGICSPKVVNKDLEDCDVDDELSLKVLLIDLELSVNLYMEILKISLGEK